MKFAAALSLTLCLFAVACHGVPVERETLLSIEQPVDAVLAEQPVLLRRVARRGYGGYGGGFPGGYGGYGGGFPGGYGGYGGGYPGIGGGYGGGIASSSAQASAQSGAVGYGGNQGYYG